MPYVKRTFALACVVLIACADTGDEDSTMADDTLAMEPATVSLADYAGTWNMAVISDRGDTIPSLTLVATADAGGWTMNTPGRDPIPLTVWAEGDSVMTEAGPFESMIRKGVQVSNRMVYRLDGDRLIGRGTARYETAESDSVVTINSEGTRVP